MPDYKLKKKDTFVEYFVGVEYEIGHPKTIGEFASLLEQMAQDVGAIDPTLRIDSVEVDPKNNIVRFLLEGKGIIQ